jgi:hypothetical protein
MTWWRTSRRVRGRARMVRGVPQTKSPRGVSFLEREQEREEERTPGSGWRIERSACFIYIQRPGTHPRAATADSPPSPHGQSAEPTRTVRVVRGRSGTPTRTVRYLFQSIQYCPSPHRAAREVRVTLADGPLGADGQSSPPPRTVRPSFYFSA